MLRKVNTMHPNKTHWLTVWLCALMLFMAGQSSAATAHLMNTVFTAAQNSIGFSQITYGQYLGNPVYIAVGNDFANPALSTPYAVKSSDGIIWTPITNLPIAAPNLWDAVIGNNTIVASGDNFVATSSDGGATWTNVTASIAQTPAEQVLGVDWNSAASLFIAYEGTLSPLGALLGIQWRTSTNGITWSAPVVTNLPATSNISSTTNYGNATVLLDSNPAFVPSPDSWGFVPLRFVYSGIYPSPVLAASATVPAGLIMPSNTSPVSSHGGVAPTVMMVGKNAAGNGVVSTSIDGGANWSALSLSGTTALGSVVWNAVEGLFVTEDILGNLYSSPDGAVWSNMNLSVAFAGGWIPTLQAGASDGARFFIAVGNQIRAIVARLVLDDFNGDGKSDLTWRHTTGDTVIWNMNGNNIAGVGGLGVIATTWKIVATGDFNGDGKSDYLWRNTANGDTAIWTMNGSTVLGIGGLGVVPLGWAVAGVGDFNGDGKSDILWRNTAAGDAVIWKMNGFAIIAQGGLGQVSIAWKIAGTGDFNGDGKDDIVWLNTVTGDAVNWLMNGTAIAGFGGLGQLPLSWSISRTGDVNGDGRSDIIWRNTVGVVAIWTMSATGQLATAQGMGTLPLNWRIAATGDYNGDGKSDILWRDANTGNTVIWTMNGFTIVSSVNIAQVTGGWTITP